VAHHELADRLGEDPVIVRTGDSLELRLRENPSTGFRWEVVESGEPACALVHDDFEPGQRAGEPGVRVYRWSANGAGRCTIALRLRRQWDSPDVAPRRRIGGTIVVEGPETRAGT
jgi:predicted secreted protein